MKANVGGVDRMLRIAVGLLMLVLTTGVFRFCGAYTLLGMNTCPVKQDQA